MRSNSEEFLQLEFLVLVLLELLVLLVFAVVTVTTGVDNSDGGGFAVHAGLGHGHTLRVGTWLHHHLLLLHAGLHHHRLLHSWLHHTGLLHARLHLGCNTRGWGHSWYLSHSWVVNWRGHWSGCWIVGGSYLHALSWRSHHGLTTIGIGWLVKGSEIHCRRLWHILGHRPIDTTDSLRGWDSLSKAVGSKSLTRLMRGSVLNVSLLCKVDHS